MTSAAGSGRSPWPFPFQAALLGGWLLVASSCGSDLPEAGRPGPPSPPPAASSSATPQVASPQPASSRAPSPGSSPSPAAAPAAAPPQAPPPLTSLPEVGRKPGRPQPSLWSLQYPEQGEAPSSTTGPRGVLENSGYNYSCRVPASWVTWIPAELSNSRCRLVHPPGNRDVRLLVIPWGIYDRPERSEIESAEHGWILGDPRLTSATMVSETHTKVGGRRAVERQWVTALRDLPGEWRCAVTYVVARPKLYGLVLLCPEAQAEEWRPVYEKMVQSFVASDPKGGQVPSGSPSPAPSP